MGHRHPAGHPRRPIISYHIISFSPVVLQHCQLHRQSRTNRFCALEACERTTGNLRTHCRWCERGKLHHHVCSHRGQVLHHVCNVSSSTTSTKHPQSFNTLREVAEVWQELRVMMVLPVLCRGSSTAAVGLPGCTLWFTSSALWSIARMRCETSKVLARGPGDDTTGFPSQGEGA